MLVSYGEHKDELVGCSRKFRKLYCENSLGGMFKLVRRVQGKLWEGALSREGALI